MPLYYNGDLDQDLQNISTLPHTSEIQHYAHVFAYGRLQQLARDRQCHKGAMDTYVANQCLPSILELADRVGLSEFCRITQILWAKKSRDSGLPTGGAWDITFAAS